MDIFLHIFRPCCSPSSAVCPPFPTLAGFRRSLLTGEFVVVQELHLQPLPCPLGQEIRGRDGRVARGAHDVRPAEHQLHGLQHVGQHHSRTQRLHTHTDNLAVRFVFHLFHWSFSCPRAVTGWTRAVAASSLSKSFITGLTPLKISSP